MEIRSLALSDHDDWLPLWLAYLEFYETVLSDDQTALTFGRLVDPAFPVHAALARDAEGRAIGFVHWLTHPSTSADGPYCYLEDLFVTPDVRGTGAGRALIATVADWARAHGCAQVYWLTQSHNATARVLYDRVADDTGFVHYAIEL
ncbi:GNAT family N-acetyltransferase [Microbacterium sp. 2FI]|uniref:GNAT family N-acetyltransferase n=1 Tax=Microbacterium sp. 2FI TaxID=2502193 RepID=UPI0010F77E0F|nr:GNAT family N-acetyltransferase [Microbacterium sp. 2FI]